MELKLLIFLKILKQELLILVIKIWIAGNDGLRLFKENTTSVSLKERKPIFVKYYLSRRENGRACITIF
jgi:hypothetical protein